MQEFSGSSTRREILSNTRMIIQYLRGKNIIISSNVDAYNQLRGPFDVINVGKLLQLSPREAAAAIGENCFKVIQHGQARKLRYVPVEVVTLEDMTKR